MRRTNVSELTRHFFRRFFENDLVQTSGDTVTTIVRAISIVAAPGLMLAFWLQNQYPQRSRWGRIEDEYFFVLFSFVAMAGVAIFEWEMLFPDRLDFLVLSPLSLKPWEMPAAKAVALAMFLGLFLVAANIFGVLILPLVVNSHIWAQLAAQALATSLAGIFGALLITFIGGVLLCILPPRIFGSVSPLLRMLAVTALALLVVHYARFGDAMPQLLADGGHRMAWVPPFWFLGLYQRLQHGSSAAPFALWMARRAGIATATVITGVLVVYPLAWVRMRNMAIEETVGGGAPRYTLVHAALHTIIRNPQERAVFHFIGQTMARTSRYHVYMAMYFGTGLALAIACATRVSTAHGLTQPALSRFGLHAVMPLLVFWTVAGLKMAFAFPMHLQARWIFRTTGAELTRCLRASRSWALGCGLAVVFAVTIVLLCLRSTPREILVQAVSGICLCMLLLEGFFFAQTTVPFSRGRQPGKTSLPLLLTLYVGVLGPFLLAMMLFERKAEKNLPLLLCAISLVPITHWTLRVLREWTVLVEEEREGGETEFQLLNLSSDIPA